MEFGLRDIIYLVSAAISVTAVALAIKHGLKELIRDKYDVLNKDLRDRDEALRKEISDLKLENERLNSRLVLLEHAMEWVKKRPQVKLSRAEK